MSLIHQRRLFAQHSQDLCQVCNIDEHLFVCPICLRVFSANDLGHDQMDVGHVWPNFIRRKSERAKHQQILLCKDCNSKAGRRADAAMQEYEHLTEILGSSPSHKLARVSVFVSGRPDLKPITIQAYVRDNPSQTLSIAFEKAKTEQRRRNYTFIEERLQWYAQQGPISVAVEPPINARLAQFGWLMSAYLLAFFTFGYRYILHERLNPVREQIRMSFTEAAERGGYLGFREAEDIAVGRWINDYYADPEIGLFLSVKEEIPHHLYVDFLACGVWLPLPNRPDIIDFDTPPPTEATGAAVDASTPEMAATVDWAILLGEADWTIEAGVLVPRSV